MSFRRVSVTRKSQDPGKTAKEPRTQKSVKGDGGRVTSRVADFGDRRGGEQRAEQVESTAVRGSQRPLAECGVSLSRYAGKKMIGTASFSFDVTVCTRENGAADKEGRN